MSDMLEQYYSAEPEPYIYTEPHPHPHTHAHATTPLAQAYPDILHKLTC